MTKGKGGGFEIVSGYTNTSLFLSDVQEAADAHRDALGFLPKSVFEEFARRDNLFVLTEIRSDGQCYAGHLLFQRRFPRTQVVQIFVLQQYRRHGLATQLIDELKKTLTDDCFTSIYARVAEDLVEANTFWEQQEFYVQRVEQGGVTRNRQILVRCHELESPQLFPTASISAHNPLGLRLSSSDVVPMFLLDLNVLFDLAPRRLRHDDAVGLFQAERMNFCRLAISKEIREELRRTTYQGKTNPMEDYLDIFPSFPLFKGDDSAALIKELASLIFPHKHGQRLSASDLSDLRHVATVIQHDLAGLITSDSAILAAAPKLMAKHGIEVISPSAFRLDDSQPPGSSSVDASDATLALLDVSSKDEPAVHGLLSGLGLPGSTIAAKWLPTGVQTRVAMRLGVWDDATLIGYLTSSARHSADTIVARVAVDETNAQALSAARMLLIYLLEQLASHGPRQVWLELASCQSLIRDLAVGFGFRGTPDQHRLGKLILARVLTRETWNAHRAAVSSKSGLKLPENIPAYRGTNQHIQVLTPDGNQTHISLEVLESLLSPALFCLPGRPAVITPVQKTFSEPLLGHSPQRSLLPHGTVSLFHDRHYLSSPRALKYFKRGTLILFYESTKRGGRGEIIAIARVREAYLRRTDALSESDLMRSVLTSASVADIGKSSVKTITVFDNIFHLPRGVSLELLRRIGCGRPNDLISTHVVTDVQLQQILTEAFNNG